MATGHTPSRRHPEYWGGDIPWINVGDARIVDGSVIHATNECTNPLGIENSAAVVLPAGTVCLSRTGSIGYAIVLGREMATSQGFVNWVCGDSLLPRFLQLLFLAERSFLHEISEGVAHTTIYFPEAKAFHICIPPIEIQSQIAERVDSELSRVTQGVEALTRVRANLKRYRAAVLKAACEGTLVPTEADLAHAEGRDYEAGEQLLERILTARCENWTGKGKYKTPTPPDTAGLTPLPEGWTWSSIGECFRVAVGATPSRKAPEYWNGSIPWVSSGEVRFRPVGSTRESITTEGLDNSSTQINPRGSVLLAMIGEGKTRGQVGWLTVDACNNQNCAAIWVPETPVPTMFVVTWLWSRYDETRRDSSGNNQPALNKSRVEALPFPVPPLAEQHRIVAEVERRLSIIDGLETLVKTNLARAGRLRQSILAKAFCGELVPASGHGAASPPPAPRKKKGPPNGGPEGRPTAGKDPVQSSASR
jgi:type I restriction enzyme S subunit